MAPYLKYGMTAPSPDASPVDMAEDIQTQALGQGSGVAYQRTSPSSKQKMKFAVSFVVLWCCGILIFYFTRGATPEEASGDSAVKDLSDSDANMHSKRELPDVQPPNLLQSMSSGHVKKLLSQQVNVRKERDHSKKEDRDFKIGDRDFIIGGDPVQGGAQYKFAVLLTILSPNGTATEFNKYTCTGSLLDHRHVLTAAHCFLDTGDREEDKQQHSDLLKMRSPVMAYLGYMGPPPDLQIANFSKVVSAEAIYVHSSFDTLESPAEFDIAVIRLSEEVQFDEYTMPVTLASPEDQLPETCTPFGFGITLDENDDQNLNLWLMHAPGILSFTSSHCNTDLLDYRVNISLELEEEEEEEDEEFRNMNKSDKPCSYRSYVRSETYLQGIGRICHLIQENEKSICAGDSGGPLMCTPKGTPTREGYADEGSDLSSQSTLKQFGIHEAMYGNYCGEPGTYTTSKSVQYHHVWINSVALPLLKGSKDFWVELDDKFFPKCLDMMEWSQISADIPSVYRSSVNEYKNLVCRKFISYVACKKYNPNSGLQLCTVDLNNVNTFFTLSPHEYCQYSKSHQNGLPYQKLSLSPYFSELLNRISRADSTTTTPTNPTAAISTNPDPAANPTITPNPASGCRCIHSKMNKLTLLVLLLLVWFAT